MTMSRRDMFGWASATALLAGASGGSALAAAAPPERPVPLAAVGLDLLGVYRRMIASADSHEGTYWCFAGPLPIDAEEVGSVACVQEETFRAQRTDDLGPDGFRLDWREAGVFRDMQSGNLVTAYLNPDTGASVTLPKLHHDPARFTVHRSGDGIDVQLESHTNVVHGVTVAAAVVGERVALTHTEFKSGLTPGGRWMCTTMRIFAELAALKSAATSVAARGFYSVRVPNTGKVFVSGLMQKGAADEKVNPLAWERIRSLYPDFFVGADRIDTRWS